MENKEILQLVKDKKPEYKSFAEYDNTDTAKRLISLIKEGYIMVKSGLGEYSGGRNQWGEDCWLMTTAKGERYLDFLKK